jgi:hypothetical protein
LANALPIAQNDPSLTRSRLLITVVLALAACALSAPAAPAATPGLNLSGVPTAQQLDEAEAVGARAVRVFVLWDTVNTTPAIVGYGNMVKDIQRRGLTPILVIVSGNRTAPDVASYADFLDHLASQAAGGTPAVAYEIWNEEDALDWWKPAPDPAAYVQLFNAASSAIRRADGAAVVIVGPTTGNNYDWINSLYDAGLRGSSFDAVAVHTDTACLTSAPDSYYRDNGRIGRFTFLSYREVRATMLAHGDDKPIWMTELGWSSSQGANAHPLCQSGTFAGQKPSGVTEAEQADNLKLAYHCLALDPYVQMGIWFTARDAPGESLDELRHYGILRSDLTRKPAWDAFKAVAGARNGDALPGVPCGDFEAPTVKILVPGEGLGFEGSLKIEASAVDTGGSGLARITFRVDGNADEIRNFTTDLANGRTVSLDWQGAKNLSTGDHTIRVEAVDNAGNVGAETVTVTKAAAGTLKSTMSTRTRIYRVRCTRRVCTVTGKVSGPKGISVGGKAKIAWQQRIKVSKNGRTRRVYKTIHRGLKPAGKPFKFKQRLRRSGSWRVKVFYLGKAPLKKSASPFVSFKVK